MYIEHAEMPFAFDKLPLSATPANLFYDPLGYEFSHRNKRAE